MRRILIPLPLACAWIAALSVPPAECQPVAPLQPVRLRVLTLNMNGLRYPPQLGWLADRSDCANRFRAAGAQIRNADPPYDIVAIQELYRVSDLHIVTCDPTPFLDALERAGGRSGKPHHILFAPKGQGAKLEADGGIGLITPHSMAESQAVRFAGSGGPFLAARGVLYARIALRNSSLAVDVYAVHLSPGHRNSGQRRRELETLSKLVAARSSASGNPVVVLGDFNIEGPPHAGAEYQTILGLLGQPRDLFLDGGPAGAGYTFDCFANALAAMRRCGYQARIDYIWIVTNPSFTNSDYEVTAQRVQRVEWRTDRPNPLPVSDHYGIEAYLSIERKVSPSPARRDR